MSYMGKLFKFFLGGMGGNTLEEKFGLSAGGENAVIEAIATAGMEGGKTMKINIRGFALGEAWDRATQDREMNLPDGAAVGDLLNALNLDPDIERILLVFINGRPCADRKNTLSDGDEVTVFPPLDGG
mgnify:CR=1 FL=1